MIYFRHTTPIVTNGQVHPCQTAVQQVYLSYVRTFLNGSVSVYGMLQYVLFNECQKDGFKELTNQNWHTISNFGVGVKKRLKNKTYFTWQMCLINIISYYMTINISFIWLAKSMRFFLDRTLWILSKPSISPNINCDWSRRAFGTLY